MFFSYVFKGFTLWFALKDRTRYGLGAHSFSSFFPLYNSLTGTLHVFYHLARKDAGLMVGPYAVLLISYVDIACSSFRALRTMEKHLPLLSSKPNFLYVSADNTFNSSLYQAWLQYKI